MNKNYSFSTSLPPYKENLSFKKTQCDEVYAFIRKGMNNLLQISKHSAIPQAIVSARVSDLMKEGRVKYDGETVYMNRRRKKLVIVEKEIKKQAELF